MKRLIFRGGIGTLATLFTIVVLAQSAGAATFIAPGEDQGNVTIGSLESHKNLYTAGADVLISGTTTGDLYAAGGSITVDGPVEQDVVVAAGEVTINGTVGGDVRMAGGKVTINGLIAGDVIVFGGTTRIAEKSSIGGDLVSAGGELILDASVSGLANIIGGAVVINSQINGELKVDTDETLEFGSKAIVPGKITYKGRTEAVVQEGAQISSIDFQQKEHRSGAAKKFAGMMTLGFILKLLAAIVAALLLLRLFPLTAAGVLASIATKPWVNLGIGLLALIVTPILSIVLLFVFVGYYIALLVLFSYILLLILSGVAAAVFIGAFVVQKLTKKPNMVFDWQAVVIGVVLMAVLKFIPVVGWLVAFGLMLMAFGAMVRGLKDRIDSEQGNRAEEVSIN